jgi:hypothetical protein
MKLKLNKDGSAVVRNGAPVYVMHDGSEREIDGAAAMKLAIGKHFEASRVMDKLNIPAGMAAAFFGDSFQIQGGKLVAVNKDGIQLYSTTRHGELANFDEALSQLVDRYPSKAKILREPSNSGATAGQQAGAGSTINRAQFDAMPHADRAKFFANGGRIDEAANGPAPVTPPVPHSAKTISRAQFDAMPQPDRYKFFGNGGKIID